MEHFGLSFQMPRIKMPWLLLPLNFKLKNYWTY